MCGEFDLVLGMSVHMESLRRLGGLGVSSQLRRWRAFSAGEHISFNSRTELKTLCEISTRFHTKENCRCWGEAKMMSRKGQPRQLRVDFAFARAQQSDVERAS